MAEAYKKLNAWKNSIKLESEINKISKKFPEEEKYDLTSQIRRAVKSISNNIAEGSGVSSKKHQLNYYHIAVGSCNEVENLFNIAYNNGYIDTADKIEMEDLVIATRKPLFGLIKYVKEKMEMANEKQ